MRKGSRLEASQSQAQVAEELNIISRIVPELKTVLLQKRNRHPRRLLITYNMPSCCATCLAVKKNGIVSVLDNFSFRYHNVDVGFIAL
ncbi:hypothetical protein TNCT_261151 [Trichonephila clavata]|uniref:Uncharacterized protein n=1 Tax=Trichonephila clavata TaxID=2740835 RepID=A0A8X6KUV5_TRICU|nr:hypothetical protein TNCT_261151 [Trichonephila clavata]